MPTDTSLTKRPKGSSSLGMTTLGSRHLLRNCPEMQLATFCDGSGRDSGPASKQ